MTRLGETYGASARGLLLGLAEASATTPREALTAMKTSHDTLPEAELLQRMLDLDESAWREFQHRYDRMIWTCIHRVVSRFNGVVSSDAIQEIRGSFYASLLANDMHKLRRFEVERGNKFGSWIGLLAINTAWDYLRVSSKRTVIDPMTVAEVLRDDRDLIAHQSVREDFDRLSAVVRSLPARDQKFVQLYFVDELSPQEIAEVLGLKLKSVYTRKHRIVRYLREAFAAQQRAAPRRNLEVSVAA